jgi:hypothetical protein
MTPEARNKAEKDLADFCFVEGALDPYGWVMGAFRWGHGELERHPEGPDDWQRDVLDQLGDWLRHGMDVDKALGLALSRIETVSEPFQLATASGHGIGKSALVAIIIMWAMSTKENTRGVVTANTETQLKTKTWAELAKWYSLCITKHWFKFTDTAIFAASKDPEKRKKWRIDMVAWSERNTEAFAGLHNEGGRILLIFDEASAIPDLIWEVAEGALTDKDTEIIWLAFGNPTQALGRFRECFRKFKHRWRVRQIDSRTVVMTNKELLQRWIDDYGPDSDFCRVRVRGMFPLVGENALLGEEEVLEAMARSYTIEQISHAPTVLGVDVARQGADCSVITRRQGKVMWKGISMRIPDTMLIAQQVGQQYAKHRPEAVFVDASGGYGVGVVDALRQIGHTPVEVYFGGKPGNPLYHDKRAEMYLELAKWVKSGGQLPYDEELKEELTAITYWHVGDKFRILGKDDIKELIGRSPDKGDAAALTFAFPAHKDPFRDYRKQIDQHNGQGGEHDPYKAIERKPNQPAGNYDPYGS